MTDSTAHERFTRTMQEHSAGGPSYALSPGVTGGAIFGGANRRYRYRLERQWGEVLHPVLFVMMNPSSADPLRDDRTVAKVQRLARRWGFASLLVGNAFAYRVTDQARLVEVADPVGPDNDMHLCAMAREARLIVMAYGTPAKHALRRRGPEVARMFERMGKRLNVLRLSIDGAPWHPLYLPEDSIPLPWTAPRHG